MKKALSIAALAALFAGLAPTAVCGTRTISDADVPVANRRVGYDLLKGAFLPPFGEGEVADFFLTTCNVSNDPLPPRICGFGGRRLAHFVRLSCGAETKGFSEAKSSADMPGDSLAAPASYDNLTLEYSQVMSFSSRNGGEGDRWFFCARGWTGVATVEKLDLSSGTAPSFLIRIRFNTEPGVSSLEPDEEKSHDAADAISQTAQESSGGGAGDIGENAPLLAMTGPGSARYFGRKADGACVPTGLCGKVAASMKGVRHLAIDETVLAIPDRMFENSPDLEAVEICGEIRSVESRAFANCKKLACVTVRGRNGFEIVDDAFAACASNLTCHIPRQRNPQDVNGRRCTPPAVVWDIAPWTRIAYCREGSRGGEAFVDGDFLWKADGDGAMAMMYIGRPCKTLVVPERLGGRKVKAIAYSLAGGRTEVENMAILSGGEDGVRINFSDEFPNLKRIGFGGKVPMEFCYGRDKGYKVFVWDSAGSGAVSSFLYNGDALPDVFVVPPWADLAAVVESGLVETNGFHCLRHGDGMAVVCYRGDETGTLSIPSEVGGLPVREICRKAFVNGGMKAVAIPQSVRVIGECAFAGCGELESAAVPEGVEEIPAGAFFACGSLWNMSLPKTLRRVGFFAFKGMPVAPELGEGVVCDDASPAKGRRKLVRP